MGLLIFYLLLALLISFTCSVLEAVLLSTPPSFVNLKVSEGSRAALHFDELKHHIDRPLSAILSLNTVAHTVGAAGVGAQASLIFGDMYFGLTSAILTVLILVLSEIIPKTIGARYWRQLALPAARLIRIMIWITYPLVLLSEQITRLFSSLNTEASVSREEVSAMVDMGAKEGVFELEENQTIQNLIRLKSIKVREIMTPRIVVKTADQEMTLKEFYSHPEYFKHSRIPIYSERAENITGYILLQTVFERLLAERFDCQLKEIKREIVVTPESQAVSSLWERLLQKNEQVALVVDEYGSFEGLVSTEDVIETMLGQEIVDERDTVADLQAYARERWNAKRRGMTQ